MNKIINHIIIAALLCMLFNAHAVAINEDNQLELSDYLDDKGKCSLPTLQFLAAFINDTNNTNNTYYNIIELINNNKNTINHAKELINKYVELPNAKLIMNNISKLKEISDDMSTNISQLKNLSSASINETNVFFNNNINMTLISALQLTYSNKDIAKKISELSENQMLNEIDIALKNKGLLSDSESIESILGSKNLNKITEIIASSDFKSATSDDILMVTKKFSKGKAIISTVYNEFNKFKEGIYTLSSIDFGNVSDFAVNNLSKLSVKDKTQLVTTALDKLGFQKEAKFVNLAFTAVNLCTSLAVAQINPFTAVTTLSTGMNLLNGFSGNMTERNGIIKQKLDEIIQLQKQILNKINELEQRIEKNQHELMNALLVINNNIKLIYKLEKESMRKDLDPCKSLVNPNAYIFSTPGTESITTLKPYVSTRFGSYTDFYNQASKYNPLVLQCKQAFNTYFTEDSDPKNCFRDIFRADEINDLIDKKTYLNLFQHSLSILNRYVKNEYVITMSNFAANYRVLSDKLSQCNKLDKVYYDKCTNIELNASLVYIYSSILLGMYCYNQYTDNFGNILTPKEILNSNSSVALSIEKLTMAKNLIALSLLQQSVISGDILIPIAFNLLDKKPLRSLCDDSTINKFLKPSVACHQSPDINLSDRVIRGNNKMLDIFFNNPNGLLYTNDIFAINLAYFVVYNSLIEKKHHLASYQFALSITDDSNWLKILIGKYDFKYLNKSKSMFNQQGWHINIKGRYIPLPSIDDASNYQFLVHPIALKLTDLLIRITIEINDLNFINTVGIDNDDLYSIKLFLLTNNLSLN